jgi:protein-glutamine gamma-glutamyltransferase
LRFNSFLKEKQFRLKLILWSFLLYIAVLLPFVSQHKITVILVTIALFIGAAFLKLKDINIPAIVRFVALGSSIFYIKQVFGTFRGLEPGISFLSFLLGIKILEMNSKRDFFIFTLIIEVFLVAQILSDDSLMVVGYVFMVTIFLFYLMFRLSGEDLDYQLIDKERILITIKIFIHSIPLMLILYFTFPRLNIGYLFPFSINTKSQIGFTGSINPGDIAKLALTDDPVLRIKFKNNKSPSKEEQYYRGSTLAMTKGLSWSKGYVSNGHNYIFGEDPLFVYDVLFNDMQASMVFALDNTKRVIRKSSGLILKQASNTWKFIPYNNQKIRYQGITTSVDSKPLKYNVKSHYLKTPENLSEKIKLLSKKIGEKYNSVEDIIASYRTFILKNKFIYTLSPGKYDEVTGLDDFLFKRRKGFCEHYAAAIAVLLRLNKIPTRVIAGFQGGEYNEIGDFYLIKTKDAHAWIEYFHPIKGWQRLDPTSWIAPSRIRLGANEFNQTFGLSIDIDREVFLKNIRSSRLSILLKVLDMAYYELNRRFLEFDFEAQKSLFKKFNFNIRRPYQLMIGAIFLIITLSIFSHYLFLRNEVPFSIIELEYSRLVLKLKKLGIQKQPHHGPLSVLETIDQKTENYDELVDLLLIFSELKYSKIKDYSQLKSLSTRVKQL